MAWLLPSNRSSFRPFAALVGCSPVQVDPPPAHLWTTCISTCPHISNHTVEHFRRIFRQKKCEIKLICDLSGSCHRWPVVVLYRQSKAAHLLCLDCDTCSRYDTLDLLIAPASLLQDASLILFTKPPVNSSKMAFRSRARQFERKLSQTFLSRLRGRERSSVEVVNSSSSGFMRVVTR